MKTKSASYLEEKSEEFFHKVIGHNNSSNCGLLYIITKDDVWTLITSWIINDTGHSEGRKKEGREEESQTDNKRKLLEGSDYIFLWLCHP